MTTLVAILGCAAGAHALAGESGASMFSLHGFGTAGLTHSDARNADFVGASSQPDGAGYSRSWSAGIDSRVGVQASAQLSGRVSAIVQVVSQHLYDGSWRPQVEWANLKYQLTPDLSIRAGRTVTAPFMLSDTRLVAYTYSWIRPPPELYGEYPVTNMDGVDVHYRVRTGTVSHSLSAAYGQTSLRYPTDGSLTARDILEISDSMEWHALTLRLGYASLRARVGAPAIQTLFSGFSQFGIAASGSGFVTAGAQANAMGARYSSQLAALSRYSFAILGVSYDPGDWLLMSEWSRESGDGIFPHSTAWYALAGHRTGRFTPYVAVARVRSRVNDDPGITTAGLPPSLASAAAALNAGLAASFNSLAASQSSTTLGMRWDLVKNIDLKLQYDRLKLDGHSTGRLGNVQPAFQSGGNVNVFSVAMDFVF